MTTEPQGIVGVLLDNGGRVMAEATDFHRGGSAGVEQWEAQKWRVRQALAVDYINGVCPPVLAAAIRQVGHRGPEELVKHMCRENGWNVRYIAIGYAEKIDERLND